VGRHSHALTQAKRQPLKGGFAWFGGFDQDQIWDVLDEIPEDSGAVILLLEHRWAIPLRDAVHKAGGVPIADGFVHQLDLVAVGLLAREEAAVLGAASNA
jgi:hypothetical protein